MHRTGCRRCRICFRMSIKAAGQEELVGEEIEQAAGRAGQAVG